MFLKSLPKSILCARPKSMILMRGWGTERFSSMMFSGWKTQKQNQNKVDTRPQTWTNLRLEATTERYLLNQLNQEEIGRLQRVSSDQDGRESRTDRQTAGWTHPSGVWQPVQEGESLEQHLSTSSTTLRLRNEDVCEERRPSQVADLTTTNLRYAHRCLFLTAALKWERRDWCQHGRKSHLPHDVINTIINL